MNAPKRGRGGSHGPHPRRAPAKKSGGCPLAMLLIPFVAVFVLVRALLVRTVPGGTPAPSPPPGTPRPQPSNPGGPGRNQP